MQLNTYVYVKPHQVFGVDSVLNGQVGLVTKHDENPNTNRPWSLVQFDFIYKEVANKLDYWVEDEYLREATDEERATCSVQLIQS